MTYIDRTITDSFCHANLGPRETRTGRIILELERELQHAVPNLTLIYDPEVTSDDFLQEGAVYQPVPLIPPSAISVVNRGTYSVGYGVASCYNILPLGGAALPYPGDPGPAARLATSIDDFF